MTSSPNQVDKLTAEELAHKPVLSRGMLQEIEADPSKLETVARLMGAVNLDNLFRHMQNPAVNVTARLEFQKMLNKMGRLEPEEKSTGNAGPQVIINITRAKEFEAEGLTIEGQAVAE